MKKFTCTIIIALALHGAANAEKLYFYTGKKYGYEYVFNPLNLIFNAGFDILQCREGDERDLFSIPYGRAMDNMLMNLKNPAKAIGVYGPKAFVMEEVFPLTFSENARWWPNYQLHFIGGCVTFTYLHDYFAYHGYENPDFFAALAYWAFHFTNEVVENNYRKGYTCDAVADIYIFDIMLMGLSQGPALLLEKAEHGRLVNAAHAHRRRPGSKTPGVLLHKWLLPFSETGTGTLLYWGLNFVLGFRTSSTGDTPAFGAGIRSRESSCGSRRQLTMVWCTPGRFRQEHFAGVLSQRQLRGHTAEHLRGCSRFGSFTGRLSRGFRRPVDEIRDTVQLHLQRIPVPGKAAFLQARQARATDKRKHLTPQSSTWRYLVPSA